MKISGKKVLAICAATMLAAGLMTGCNKGDNKSKNEFDKENEISVVSREDGSGTRGAFIELFGIEKKDSSGEKVDYTTEEANVTNSTSVMTTTVEGDVYSIGYISLGALNDTVKALKIDGAEATVDNIKDESYKIARPFNIATKDSLSEVATDFMKYIMSSDGQKVIEDNGYISVSEEGAYSGNKPSGKIVIAVMEKLKEAYIKLNANATIEIQESDSTTGMMSAADGICDIGMASRELKDSELAKGLKDTKIAMDGIAVIVNNDNPVDEMTSEQVMNIYTGESTVWSDIITE